MRFVVEIEIDGVVVATLAADRLEPKLLELGEGDGRYAFAWIVPSRFRDGETHQVSVRAPDLDFTLRSKVDGVTIAPTAAMPFITLTSRGLRAVRMRLLGGQYSKSALFDLWQDDRRLAEDVAFQWRGPEGDRELILPLTESLRGALRAGPLFVAGPGMREAGLALGVIDALNLDLVLSADLRNRLTLTGPETVVGVAGEHVDLHLYDGDRRLQSFDVALIAGEANLGAMHADATSFTITLDGEPLTEPRPIARRWPALLRNVDFDRWTAQGPSDWMLAEGVAAERDFVLLPADVRRQSETSGEICRLSFPRRRRRGTAVLSQPISLSAATTGLADVTFVVRAVDGFAGAISLSGAAPGACVRVDLPASDAWTVVSGALQPIVGAGLLLTPDAQSANTLDIAHLSLGDRASVAEAAPAIAPVNADLSRWPKGIDVHTGPGGGELAEGWFGVLGKGDGQCLARPLIDAGGSGTAMAFAVPESRQMVRLDVGLIGDAAGLAGAVVRCEAATPDGARTLLARHAKAQPDFTLIERICLLQRGPAARGGKPSSKVLAVIGRRVLIGRDWRSLALTVPGDVQVDPTGGDLFLAFEFRAPVAVAIRNLAIGRDAPPTAEDQAYLRLEDPSIWAQADRLRGLERWVEPRLATPEREPPLPRPIRRVRWSAPGLGSVEVVVCVYNAIDETLACLASLIGASETPHTVRIIDDASDPAVHRRLAQFVVDKPWMRLERNEQNRGYTWSADHGVRTSDADWVVLLNSDVLVTDQWLEGLFECAASDPRIVMVGPLSNAATFQSAPELHDASGAWKTNALPLGWTADDLAGRLRATSQRDFPSVPLLNGFCTLIRREAFTAVGGLNVAAFPHGYGEENDLCIRIAKAGGRLAVADQVYVYHAKSASFGGERRTTLSRAGGQALKALHPDVDIVALTTTMRDLPTLAAARARVRDLYQEAVRCV